VRPITRKEKLVIKEATRGIKYTTEPSLYLAFELSKEKWKLGFNTGLGQHPRRRTIDTEDLLALQ
jgi:hypothetical protein